MYKFFKTREGESKLEIELVPSVYGMGVSKVVDVLIQLKNIGNVAIFTRVPNAECVLEIKAISEKLRDSVIYWEDSRLLPLLSPIEFLKDFEFGNLKEPYIIEPQSTESVHVIFSTTHHGIVLLKANFVDKDDYVTIANQVIDLRTEITRGV